MDARPNSRFTLEQIGLSARTRQNLAHPLERFADVLAGVGVGEAQVTLPVAAERRAGEAGDACFVEEYIGQLIRLVAGLCDAREGVECSLGRYAFDAWELVEAGYDQVSARPELSKHTPHCVLRPLERRETGVLRGRAGARVGVDL